MKRFFMSLTMLAAISSLFVIQAVALSTAKTATTAAPIFSGGTFSNAPITKGANTGNFLSGTFKVTKFVAKKGQLSAIGDVTGTITNAAGDILDTFTADGIEVPVLLAGSQASCDILNLDLGPLDLDLLGLNVDLSAISLDITATPGAGNLLGNLLCAVAGLLDRNGAVNGLAGLLNNILRILG